MKDIQKRIDDMLNELKEERDELKLKLHLAKMNVSEEWDKLELKLEKLEGKAQELGEVTVDASKDVGEAAKLLGQEIMEGFKKIAKHL
ncbi:MAG: hypothetical protein OQK46_06250 [Gammaproteobacteria bacterium]|nr:hypothetical protein [Gammaproteobacteria bacterium]